MENLHRQDVSLTQPIKFSSVMALYEEGMSRGPLLCSSLCQKLLYNGAVQKVLIVKEHQFNGNLSDDDEVFGYHIEKKKSCSSNIIETRPNDQKLLNNVQLRVSMGDCLVESISRMTEADMIFIAAREKEDDGIVYHTLPARYFWKKAGEAWKGLKRWKEDRFRMKYFSLSDPYRTERLATDLFHSTVRAERIELKKRDGADFRTIYKFSKIEADPFLFPLAFGPELSFSGGTPGIGHGFFRYKKHLNTNGIYYGDYQESFREQLPGLFGKYLDEPSADEQVSEALLKKLADPNSASKEIDALFKIFIDQYFLHRTKTFSERDRDVALRALRDDRVNHFVGIGGVVAIAPEGMKNEIVTAVIDRVLRENIPAGQQKILDLIMATFWGKNIPVMSPQQRIKMDGDPARKAFIRNYFEKKIKEGWSKDGSYERAIAFWVGQD